MTRARARRLGRWLAEATVIIIIIILYLIVFSRGQIVHGRIL